MDSEHLNQLINDQNWPAMLRTLDEVLLDSNDFEKLQEAVWLFEQIDNDFRERHAEKYYFTMWKIAFKAGKVKLSKSYAEFLLDRMIELKRIPALKKLKSEFMEIGLFKAHKKFEMMEVIIGKKMFGSEDFNLCENHSEMWKNSKNILKNFLLEDRSWNVDEWKLAYEYILKFHYDKDIFLLLAEKAIILKKENHKKKILLFLSTKKVNIKTFIEKPNKAVEELKKEELHVDYDKLAMDVMSGLIEPSINEQKRIIISIQDLSKEELLEKGSDMIVAFGLLGMDKVVIHLCERLMPLLQDVKDRASVQFMKAQALFNSSEFYKVIDLIDDTFDSEPLVDSEVLAFNYLKAESYLKLKKYKLAKELFLIIKKNNPHYRLVGERLRHLEEIK